METIDKRTTNGNNGTKRREDAKPRKRPVGYYVLKDEVKAGLRARFEAVMDFYGGLAGMARAAKVTPQTVQEWKRRGMISANGARAFQRAYKRDGCVGFRASFCRPDLTFDNVGRPLTVRCKKREMLRAVTREELATKPEQPSWKKIKAMKAQKAKE